MTYHTMFDTIGLSETLTHFLCYYNYSKDFWKQVLIVILIHCGFVKTQTVNIANPLRFGGKFGSELQTRIKSVNKLQTWRMWATNCDG